jgi:LysR family glycine cleavage system transcriptional activator
MSVTHSAVSQHIKQLEAWSASRSLSATVAERARLKKDGSYALQIREALQHIADATRMVQIKPRTWK